MPISATAARATASSTTGKIIRPTGRRCRHQRIELFIMLSHRHIEAGGCFCVRDPGAYRETPVNLPNSADLRVLRRALRAAANPFPYLDDLHVSMDPHRLVFPEQGQAFCVSVRYSR